MQEFTINITPLEFGLSYVLIVIAGLLIVTAVGHIIYQKRSSTSMSAWILFILFLPYIAAPLYFIIGIRKRKSKDGKSLVHFPKVPEYEGYIFGEEHAIANILKKNGIPPATIANDFKLISDDVEAFRLMMEQISEAKESIDICTYVFEFDTTTKAMLEALTVKAKEGVQVRLLLDIIGSLGANFRRKGFKSLREAGGEVAFFTPILKRPLQNYINLRNHRKIYLFDQSTLLSGGMNLSNEYMGLNDGTKRWKDLLYTLRGPAVHTFYTIFHNDWNYATSDKRELVFKKPKKVFTGKNYVQVVPSGPDIPKDALYEALLNAIYSAQSRIWIVTPYFVPDDNIVQALVIAQHKGVDVKLITPKESNHFVADMVRSPYMRELDDIGVDVVLYEGEMLHAKAILFDNIGGMVGSVNLDNRSLFLNYEVVTFVYSEQFIEDMENWMQSLIASSSRGMRKAGKIREAFENIMKVFAPLM